MFRRVGMQVVHRGRSLPSPTASCLPSTSANVQVPIKVSGDNRHHSFEGPPEGVTIFV